MVAPLVIAGIGLGAKFLAAQQQKKAQEEQLNAQRRMAPAEILARSAAKRGAAMEEYGAIRQSTANQLAENQINGGSPIDYAPEIAMMVSAADENPAAAEELAERQEQRLSGFRGGYNPFQRNGF